MVSSCGCEPGLTPTLGSAMSGRKFSGTAPQFWRTHRADRTYSPSAMVNAASQCTKVVSNTGTETLL
jgi:hypothetical protein